jgi:GNAT superfamily N-acetyltransferase
MDEIVCRRPNLNEAGDVCTVIQRILTSSFPMFPQEAIEDYLEPWTADRVISRLEHGHDVLIAAYVKDEITGLVSGTAPEAGVGTIIWLLVDARWRGHKVGRALYEAGCHAYRGLGAHKMKLTAPSERAKRFYESCGMRVEGFHPNHWYRLEFFSLGTGL